MTPKGDFFFDPFTPEAIEDPYPLYAYLRDEDPIHWSEKFRAWIITRYEDVRRFFQDEEFLSADRSRAKRGKKHSFKAVETSERVRTVGMDPPDHTEVRVLLAQGLAAPLRAMPPRIDAVLEILFREVEAAAGRVVEGSELSGEVDLIETLAYPLPIQVIAELFAIPEEQRKGFRDVSDRIARGMDQFFSGETVAASLQELGAFFAGLVFERRGTEGDDLIRLLCEASQGDDRMSDLEVVAMATSLVFGGYETTVNLIGNGLLALLKHPEQKERLVADPTLAVPAIEEMLRYDTPPQAISRTVTQDFEWHGKNLRAGDLVLGCLGAANRDDRAFQAPDEFDIGRDPNPHIAFGLGSHFCPGALLSRLEVRAALPALLARYPRLRLAGEARRRKTFILRGVEHLPLRLD